MVPSETLLKQFNNWKKKNAQHGGQVFSRFIMLKYMDAISELSDEFVFKGGNLLWHYIKTPRQTIDLDLCTVSLKSHLEVKKVIDKATKHFSEIIFNIKEFQELNNASHLGAAIIIEFETITGQRNQFSIDIVYSLPTDISKVKSTTSNNEYQSASIENIIADKISAAHKFKAGNTRMKDFDDLWRISKTEMKVSNIKLKDLMSKNSCKFELDFEWTPFLEDHWRRHSKRYKDLPKDLASVFKEVNNWLSLLEKK